MIDCGGVEVECHYCNEEVPDDVQVCMNCGSDIIYKKKSWHSLHKLLWDNKINQDILETLNELSHQEKYFKEKHFVDVARNLNRTRGR
ncbi:MAG: hypothetical protein HVN34_02250 [Methanobacteriaceae archaeon]|nr:hypothetical protein [Methanobacteriaceae archaeon]OPY22770.1 MAG: hypothetical protein A4E26_01170 [Methanobacterium sp. PtaU1.Bin097]